MYSTSVVDTVPEKSTHVRAEVKLSAWVLKESDSDNDDDEHAVDVTYIVNVDVKGNIPHGIPYTYTMITFTYICTLYLIFFFFFFFLVG